MTNIFSATLWMSPQLGAPLRKRALFTLASGCNVLAKKASVAWTPARY